MPKQDELDKIKQQTLKDTARRIRTMSLFTVTKNDMHRYPLLFLWTANRYDKGVWSAVLSSPRSIQWRILTVNLILLLLFLGSFVAIGTPVLGTGYTWWLLAAALFAASTLGLNCLKLFNALTSQTRRKA